MSNNYFETACDNIKDDINATVDLDSENFSNWCLIPEPVLLKILAHLTARDILNAGECCNRWNQIAKDDYLWRKVFQRDFKIERNIGLKPGILYTILI